MNTETILTTTRCLGLALILGVVGAHVIVACNDHPSEPEACYPKALDWELDQFGYPRGWCQWQNGELPDNAPMDIDLNRFTHCFDLGDEQTCDACPAEETDELLREEFEAKCGYESTYFARGCYRSTENGDGPPRCCYMALIGPACTSRE